MDIPFFAQPRRICPRPSRSSGVSALACLEQAVPDMVLVDLHLPDMDDCELAKRIRSAEKFHDTVLVGGAGDRVRGF